MQDHRRKSARRVAGLKGEDTRSRVSDTGCSNRVLETGTGFSVNTRTQEH